MYHASLKVDDITHRSFVRAHADVDPWEASRELELIREDANYPGGERLSCGAFRNLWTDLTLGLKLRTLVFGHDVVTFCRCFWPKHGQCKHSALIRALEGDPEAMPVELELMTRGQGAQQLSTAGPGCGVSSRGAPKSTPEVFEGYRQGACEGSCEGEFARL